MKTVPILVPEDVMQDMLEGCSEYCEKVWGAVWSYVEIPEYVYDEYTERTGRPLFRTLLRDVERQDPEREGDQ